MAKREKPGNTSGYDKTYEAVTAGYGTWNFPMPQGGLSLISSTGAPCPLRFWTEATG
jgi:hypothetical protein